MWCPRFLSFDGQFCPDLFDPGEMGPGRVNAMSCREPRVTRSRNAVEPRCDRLEVCKIGQQRRSVVVEKRFEAIAAHAVGEEAFEQDLILHAPGSKTWLIKPLGERVGTGSADRVGPLVRSFSAFDHRRLGHAELFQSRQLSINKGARDWPEVGDRAIGERDEVVAATGAFGEQAEQGATGGCDVGHGPSLQ